MNVLTASGLEKLWSNINDRLDLKADASIVLSKQDKTLIVTKGSNNLASHTPAEILEYYRNGANVVYYDGATQHSYLEGDATTSVFYSSFVNTNSIQFTIYQINSDKSINGTRSNYVAPVTSVNNKTGNVALSASDVGADATGAASKALEDANKYTDEKVSGLLTESVANNKISTHNTSESSHNDIRSLITDLTNRLNALANSTDTDLDQMAEIVAYIKNNKGLIDSITTSKVNTSDIVDNLTTSVATKVLSAKQGVELKSLIDGLGLSLDGKSNDGHNHNDLYYTKTEIENLELITVNDIDTICGATIQVASEVTF